MEIDSNKKLKKFYNTEFSRLRNEGEVASSTSEYFGEIGSIPIEDIAYSNQLEVKKAAVQNIFKGVIHESLISDIEIIASPSIDEYRFRMDFVCTNNPIHEPHDRFGQRKRGNFNWIVDMKSCSLIPKIWFDRTRSIYEKLMELGIKNYDVVKYNGNLRYLVVRAHKDQGMLNIVTKEKLHSEQIEQAAEYAIKNGFTSVNWIHQPGMGDISNGELLQQFGEAQITVPILTIQLLVGPDTFFQNNISGFETIVSYLATFLSSKEDEISELTLYDLYSGVGTLGLLFAKYFKEVVGIEINTDSTELAIKNAELNGIENYKVVTQDLNGNADLGFAEDQVLIVDPPRVGLQAGGVDYVRMINPKYLIYISCNPITQARDLEVLKDEYEAKSIRAFDLFPHTYHVENVVILERKKS